MFVYDYAMKQTKALEAARVALLAEDEEAARAALATIDDDFVDGIISMLEVSIEDAIIEIDKEFGRGPVGYVAVRTSDGRVVGDSEYLEDLGSLIEDEDVGQGEEPELEQCGYDKNHGGTTAPFEVYEVPAGLAFEPGDFELVEERGTFLHFARWVINDDEDEDLDEAA